MIGRPIFVVVLCAALVVVSAILHTLSAVGGLELGARLFPPLVP